MSYSESSNYSDPSKNNRIVVDKPFLPICEGVDDYKFFNSYLNSDFIKENYPKFTDTIQVISLKGNKNLRPFLNTLQRVDGFTKNAANILIIMDAETDCNSTEMSIKSTLKNVSLPVPDAPCSWSGDKLKVAYLLFPTLNSSLENGALEHFCMRIIKKDYHPDEVLVEIDKTMNNLRDNYSFDFSHEFKSRLHGFFSLTNKTVGKKIGEAARAGVFDFSSPCFDSMNRLIEDAIMELV